MRRRIKIALIIIGNIVLIMTGLLYLYFYWVILPVNSSSHTLTLVKYGYIIPRNIILKHYVNNEQINDYMLELNAALLHQMPQSYGLPKFENGKIEVIVELENGLDGSIANLKMNYKNANELYEKGLLLYFQTDFSSSVNINDSIYKNQYIHFISGGERISYLEEAGSPDWTIVMDAPPPKKFTPTGIGYVYIDSNWKEENKWEIIPVN